MLRILLLAVILLGTLNGVAQTAGYDLANYGVRIEADKRLMVVLAALEMAEATGPSGKVEKLINTPLSKKGSEFRAQLLRDNASLNDDLRRRISTFVVQYKKRHQNWSDAETLTPFISMAYTLSPVPDLSDPTNTTDLPGSLLDVLDFAPLAREFYRRSVMSTKLDDYVKTYRAEADGVLRTSTREMVNELLAYLHTRPQLFFTEKVKVAAQKNKNTTLEKTETRTHERRFFIVPEMLAPQGNIDFLNVRDDYYVVLPPDKDVSFSEVRRAFLRFVVDPLVLSNSKETILLRDWTKSELAGRNKSRPGISQDVLLAVSRSLAAAIDVRQAEYTKAQIAVDQARRRLATLKTDEEKRSVTADLEKYRQSLADDTTIQLSEDYDKGLVLVFFFADRLRGVEESGFDIAGSLREMIASFDAAKESARLSEAEAARTSALARRAERKKTPNVQNVIAENPLTNRLLEIQKMIAGKDYARASSELTTLSKTYPSEPRIYYNLGRVAGLLASGTDDPDVQARQLVEAKNAYAKVLDHATGDTDRALLSLTYVALAKIYEHFDRSEDAMKLYDAAIKLDNVAGGAFREAMEGKQRLLKPQ